MPTEGKGLGWVPDLPDARDHLFAVPPSRHISVPPQIDLRAFCPDEVYDQGQLGSCTANAIAAALEFDQIKQQLPVFTPSRLFIYYNERVIEHSVRSDAGAQIRDGIKSVSKLGACPEAEWPYDIAQFAKRPSSRCYSDALLSKAVSYARVTQTLSNLKVCLARNYPIVLGFTVYDGFMSDAVASTGKVDMPDLSTEHVQGGHAVLAVGYDDITQRFTLRNSWGPSWGIGGYFTMPYAYLTDRQLASDFWQITQTA